MLVLNCAATYKLRLKITITGLILRKMRLCFSLCLFLGESSRLELFACGLKRNDIKVGRRKT